MRGLNTTATTNSPSPILAKTLSFLSSSPGRGSGTATPFPRSSSRLSSWAPPLAGLEDPYNPAHTHHHQSSPPTSLPRMIRRPEERGASEVACSKHSFKVKLDVSTYTPENLRVKIIDGFLVIEGTHEEQEDEHGYIATSFRRRYFLPPNVDRENVFCEMDAGIGVLRVRVRRISEQKGRNNERMYPIIKVLSSSNGYY